MRKGCCLAAFFIAVLGLWRMCRRSRHLASHCFLNKKIPRRLKSHQGTVRVHLPLNYSVVDGRVRTKSERPQKN